MLLKTTSVQTENVTLAPKGQTVGQWINELLAESIAANRAVTSITVEISPEDMTALKLLASPVWNDDNNGDGTVQPSLKHKFKPYRPTDNNG